MSILTNEMHFINVGRIAPEFFSCGIDCFLEIWLRHISRIFTPTGRIYILGLPKQAERQYFMLRERSYNINNSIVNPSSSMNIVQVLNSIRFDIWKYLKIHCCHSGYCFSCEQQISINNEVIEEILRSGTFLDQWSNFIIQNNTLTRIQCPHC